MLSDDEVTPASVDMGMCPGCGVPIPRVWEDSVVCEGNGHHTVPLRPVPAAAASPTPPPLPPPRSAWDEEDRRTTRTVLAFVVAAVLVFVLLYLAGRA